MIHRGIADVEPTIAAAAERNPLVRAYRCDTGGGGDREHSTSQGASLRLGAALWTAQSKLDWASVLTARARPGDRQLAQRLIGEARAFADEMDILGCTGSSPPAAEHTARHAHRVWQAQWAWRAPGGWHEWPPKLMLN